MVWQGRTCISRTASQRLSSDAKRLCFRYYHIGGLPYVLFILYDSYERLVQALFVEYPITVFLCLFDIATYLRAKVSDTKCSPTSQVSA